MKLKQTWPIFALLLMLALPFFTGSVAFAKIEKNDFYELVCDRFTEPQRNGDCLRDIRKDDVLSVGFYKKAVKFSDWKDKSSSDLNRFLNQNGKESNGGDKPNKNNEDEEESTGLAQGNDCGGAETAIIKCSQDNSGGVENNGLWALLLIVINIMSAGVAVLAIAGIVYGSIMYTTAGDKSDQVKQATDIITNVVIGVLAFALMWAGLNFIIPGGVFQ